MFASMVINHLRLSHITHLPPSQIWEERTFDEALKRLVCYVMASIRRGKRSKLRLIGEVSA